MLILRKLEIFDEKTFIEAHQEFQPEKDFAFVSCYKAGMEFSDLLKTLDDREQGRNLPDGYVPSTYLFGFVGEKLVGRVMIRHKLNESLRRIGGHIGYGVIPSERGKGYATEMLIKSLEAAKLLGIEQVLVTCDEDNLPSKKIIENAGGIFEGSSEQGEDLPLKLRFWIPVR